jgi:glutamine amidotransferase
MIAIVDYGVGNLFSLRSSLKYIGFDAEITGDTAKIRAADRIFLPGVGAFGDAADKLRRGGLFEAVRGAAGRGTPLLGICLGMQLLFDRGFEYGEHAGLALIPGDVAPIEPVIPKGYKIPHIGWNGLRFNGVKSPLFKYISEGDHVYFVHSFYASKCASDTVATAEYGVELTAAVARGNIYGTQFHPEKSGDVGLRILRAFCEL